MPALMDNAHGAATLKINLDRVRDNYRILKQQLGGIPCAGVVKANGYGLGAVEISETLYNDGCRDFFVALMDEGIQLRQHLPENANIHILGGLLPGMAPVYHSHRLIPVLGSLPEIHDWKQSMDAHPGPVDIHIDTGMSRLGLSPGEILKIADDPDVIADLDINAVISHLVMADEPDGEINNQQLQRFTDALRFFPAAKTSLANSSGIFLSPDFHFDFGRPGAALYGLSPNTSKPNPMCQVVELKGKIVQVRDVDRPETVGYGATHRILDKGRIATVPVGYADGYLRSLSNAGHAFVDGAPNDVARVDIVGRVSMDLITLDVSHVPERFVCPGASVELIGPRITADDLAAKAGTIGYEILTSLGQRYRRIYVDNNGPRPS